jgi:hypothetical protein
MSIAESNPSQFTRPSNVIDPEILRAYATEGYEQGYAQGTRDLLASYAQLIELHLSGLSQLSPDIARTIRLFNQSVQAHIGRKLDEAGYVDGGLGI